MNDIILKGDKLEYWKNHSELINIFSDEEKDGVLLLSRDLFPLFNDNDWEFFKKFLDKKDVHYTKSKKYGTFVYNIKNYTQDDADRVLDYIMYGKKYSNISNFLKKREIRLPTRKNNRHNNNNYENHDNNNNSDNNKKNDRPEIVLNNNNNYMKLVPRAKQRSKSLKKQSKMKNRTFRKDYLKSKDTKNIDTLLKQLQNIRKNLRESSK